MSDAIPQLLAEHGILIVFAAALMSSTGLPVPGSLTLLGAGAFVASGGDLRLWAVSAAGWAGAVAGDQVGYWFGARGGPRASAWAERRGMGPALDRAHAFSARWGDAGNFVCRWLVSPLAPAVNLVSGLIGVGWTPFTLYSALGELVWVGLYLGLGYAFSQSIVAIARFGGDLGVALAAGLVALVVGRWLWGRRRSGSRG